jgi:hypothetical protein
MGRSVIETFFYILRRRASFGRDLQVPEQSFLRTVLRRRMGQPERRLKHPDIPELVVLLKCLRLFQTFFLSFDDSAKFMAVISGSLSIMDLEHAARD